MCIGEIFATSSHCLSILLLVRTICAPYNFALPRAAKLLRIWRAKMRSIRSLMLIYCLKICLVYFSVVVDVALLLCITIMKHLLNFFNRKNIVQILDTAVAAFTASRAWVLLSSAAAAICGGSAARPASPFWPEPSDGKQHLGFAWDPWKK